MSFYPEYFLHASTIDTLSDIHDVSIDQLRKDEKRLTVKNNIIQDSLNLLKDKILQYENSRNLQMISEKYENVKVKAKIIKKCRLRASLKPFDFTDITLNQNDSIILLDLDNSYWYVFAENSTFGYIKHSEIDETKEIAELKKYFSDINEAKEQEEIKMMQVIAKDAHQKEIERKKNEFESNRPINLKNTGIWSVKNYVDDFGEKTDSKFISTQNKIIGNFSNTATQNSKLGVSLVIESNYSRGEEYNNSPSIFIFLYEYGSNNPVKSTRKDTYRVKLQDKDGERFDLSAENTSDRLVFSEGDSKIIHNALIKGGLLKFVITEIGTPTTNYYFEINNAGFYLNAYYQFFE
jgi:hypothetical protein